ncbi:MAG: prealbumin-like fold domain-containing protein, partial [Rhodothermia bacterium]
MLAVLGLGIELRQDDGGAPGALFDDRPVSVGETFWIDVVVQDQRSVGDPEGVISLPLDLVWDPSVITLANDPPLPSPFPDAIPIGDLRVTSNFPLQRFYDAFDAAAGPVDLAGLPAAPTFTFDGLRGGAIPAASVGSAIGITEDAFSQLRFTTVGASDRMPFTMVLAGSMSFADADLLVGVNRLESATDASRSIPPYAGSPFVSPEAAPPETPFMGVTEYIQTAATPSSLSGVVYVDEDLSGDRTVDADGVPIEMGLPNVTLQLFDNEDETNPIQETVTGPDGEYHFEDLPPGTYRIVEVQPECFEDERQTLGVVLGPNDLDGQPRGTIGDNEFFDINLASGEHGIDYNFGERTTCITKRQFLASTEPRDVLGELLGVNIETVQGTAGNDQITFTRSGNVMQVVVQPVGGTARTEEFDIDEVDAVVIEAGGGQDTVILNASDADEIFDLLPGQATLHDDVVAPLPGGGTRHTWDYGALALQAETIIVNSGS